MANCKGPMSFTIDKANVCQCKYPGLGFRMRYPDPYKGTVYENDPTLCHRQGFTIFPGCPYPFGGVMPGQYGVWQNLPHASGYPWTGLDGNCPKKYDIEVCGCENDYIIDRPTEYAGDEPCYSETPDGTVTGRYSPIDCSEYTGACNDSCDDESAVCGCWPRDVIERDPPCERDDGSVIMTVCPQGDAYNVSGITSRDGGARVQRLCGELNLYTWRGSKYKLCGGYTLNV